MLMISPRITDLPHSLACYKNFQIEKITHRHDNLGHTENQWKFSSLKDFKSIMILRALNSWHWWLILTSSVVSPLNPTKVVNSWLKKCPEYPFSLPESLSQETPEHFLHF